MPFYQFELNGRLAEHFWRWSWERPLRLMYCIADPLPTEKIVTCGIYIRCDETGPRTGTRYGEIFVMPNEFTENQYPAVVYRFSCENTRVPENVIVEMSRANFVRDLEKKVK